MEKSGKYMSFVKKQFKEKFVYYSSCRNNVFARNGSFSFYHILFWKIRNRNRF